MLCKMYCKIKGNPVIEGQGSGCDLRVQGSGEREITVCSAIDTRTCLCTVYMVLPKGAIAVIASGRAIAFGFYKLSDPLLGGG